MNHNELVVFDCTGSVQFCVVRLCDLGVRLKLFCLMSRSVMMSHLQVMIE
jgi:hypothetical protein